MYTVLDPQHGLVDTFSLRLLKQLENKLVPLGLAVFFNSHFLLHVYLEGVHMQRTEEHFLESVLSFYHVEIKYWGSDLVARTFLSAEPSCWLNVLVGKESQAHTHSRPTAQNCLHCTQLIKQWQCMKEHVLCHSSTPALVLDQGDPHILITSWAWAVTGCCRPLWTLCDKPLLATLTV